MAKKVYGHTPGDVDANGKPVVRDETLPRRLQGQSPYATTTIKEGLFTRLIWKR